MSCCGWSSHEKGIHMPSFMAWHKRHFLLNILYWMRYFSILSLFTSTNFLYVCRWLPSGNYSNQLSNEKGYIRPFLFYYHHHFYYYYYYSINLEKKERKTESKISGPSFVGENYDPQSQVHMQICLGWMNWEIPLRLFFPVSFSHLGERDERLF